MKSKFSQAPNSQATLRVNKSAEIIRLSELTPYLPEIRLKKPFSRKRKVIQNNSFGNIYITLASKPQANKGPLHISSLKTVEMRPIE